MNNFSQSRLDTSLSWFIWYFHGKSGYFEFSHILDSITSKVLFYAYENHNSTIRNYCEEQIQDNGVREILRELFSSLWETYIFHIWIDPRIHNTRIKIYIPTYHLPIFEAKDIIDRIGTIVHIPTAHYTLSDEISHIDTIALDIWDDLLDIKIYELISTPCRISVLPPWLERDNIKEHGIMKSLIRMRNKEFIRLDTHVNIDEISGGIDILKSISTHSGTQPKWKIKYYCREAGKEEIYLI